MHCTSPWAIALAQAPRRSKQWSSCSRAFSAGRYALACSRTVQCWRERALTLSLLGMGAPATVAQPATAQPRSYACHAHAPHAPDGAQRRLAQGRRERSWRHIMRDGMRSASVECVSEAGWTRLPTGFRCGVAGEERERSTSRPLSSCVSRMMREHRSLRLLASPVGSECASLTSV